jgi:hypothetical protein
MGPPRRNQCANWSSPQRRRQDKNKKNSINGGPLWDHLGATNAQTGRRLKGDARINQEKKQY